MFAGGSSLKIGHLYINPLVYYHLVGALEHVLFPISYMGCHPKPIDELHHFSRWLLHHQPAFIYHGFLVKHHFPMVFLWFSYGFPMVLLDFVMFSFPFKMALAGSNPLDLWVEIGIGRRRDEASPLLKTLELARATVDLAAGWMMSPGEEVTTMTKGLWYVYNHNYIYVCMYIYI